MKYLFLILFITSNCFAQTILIDPGHGGEDTGASTKYKGIEIHEKDLALSISKKIFKKLKRKGFQVYLTRSIDRVVTLEKRAELAEKIKADLFISIHLNSSTKKRSNGFEIYYLDNHSDAAIKKVEELENKEWTGEQKVVNQILTDLVIERTIKSSRKLSFLLHRSVMRKITRRYGFKDRGMKPGLFYVLALSKRPAALVEVGFISNKKELKKMSSHKFQSRFSDAIVRGIKKYFAKKVQKKLNLF